MKKLWYAVINGFYLTPPFKHLVAGIFSFIMVFVFLMISNIAAYYWDSGGYFNLSRSFTNAIPDIREFSIYNFPLTIRGIIYPLFLFPFNGLTYVLWGNSMHGWWVFISLLSGIFTVAFAGLFKSFGRSHLIPIPLVLLLFVWFGLFQYPLADLVALFFLVFALALLLYTYGRGNTATSKSEITHQTQKMFSYKEFLLFTLVGVLLYVAYNTRTVYLFALPGLLLILFINRHVFKKRNYLILIALIIGFFSLGVIQGLSNYHTVGAFSIFVPSIPYGVHDNIFMSAFWKGMRYNLLEGYLGDGPDNFVYWNNAGSKILEIYEIESFSSIGQWIALWFKYPVEMLGSLTRSVIVFLNPLQGDVYIYRRTNMRFVYTVLNFSMLFYVAGFIKRRILDVPFKDLRDRFKASCVQKKTCLLSLLIILLPTAIAALGIVEHRYGVSFWLVIYGLLSYVIDIRKEAGVIRKRPILYTSLFFIGFAVFVAILTEIYASNIGEMFLPILDLG